MSVKTIKDVDEEAWHEFKSMAAKNKMKMGKLFNKIIEEYEEKGKNFWDEILKGPPVLSKEEANAMMEASRKIRKDYGFRDLK